MKNIILSLCLTTMIFTMSNCEQTNPEVKSVNISSDFAAKTSNFAFDFWKNLQADESVDKNYFISPLSLHIALGMLLNGADTDTKKEIQKVLGLENQSMEEINKTYLELIENLPKVDPKVVNTIANSIWQDKNFTSEQTFIDNLTSSFKARLYNEDFGNPATVDKINKWASDNTNTKIKKILEQIEPSQVMFLINALYFKGDWTKEFKTENTQKAEFVGTNTTKMVDMMNQTTEFKYADLKDYQLVELPYGSEKYTMNIVLPKNTSIENVVKNLNAATWQSAQNSLTKRKVVVGLPKFKIEYSKKLNGILQQMGMVKAFSDQADLSKIAKPAGKLKVGFVKQDTFVAVDEKGTEAAAVTTIGIEVTSLPVYPEIICNKPFAFLITEKTSNTIMFIGKVSNL
ncbi:serpin family protein [Lacihabitans sp. CS3-21]|jgi:serine protease inhibitor|uniref:serpin family protein n=1 Tax=Lacihabitans sp. CS3-21 TaxID=2487332 RepID=UPI0020CDF71B|nr:serpin family protein [Lacihabitans sp. CS3-21]MCP9748562.1 serpin family protein [Lacihabitans sp. CS3-21]